MRANPHANGGLLLKDLKMPDFQACAAVLPKPGTVFAEATEVPGCLLRDVINLNVALGSIA
jgi:xylulose-5-phosphate/fructose-6-phosphate phosphoketolase